jgi:hypothetical protein
MKSFPHLLVLGVMLSILPLSLATQDIPYHILKIERSEDKGQPEQSAFCSIGLPESINVEGLKRIICGVTCKEKLGDYRKLFIELRYGEKYVIYIGHDTGLIALYDWNPDLRKTGQLFIFLDGNGTPVKGKFLKLDFNHKTECSCEPNKESKPQE